MTDKKEYHIEIYNNYSYGQGIKDAKSIYVNGELLGCYIPQQFKGVYDNDR